MLTGNWDWGPPDGDLGHNGHYYVGISPHDAQTYHLKNMAGTEALLPLCEWEPEEEPGEAGGTRDQCTGIYNRRVGDVHPSTGGKGRGQDQVAAGG